MNCKMEPRFFSGIGRILDSEIRSWEASRYRQGCIYVRAEIPRGRGGLGPVHKPIKDLACSFKFGQDWRMGRIKCSLFSSTHTHVAFMADGLK